MKLFYLSWLSLVLIVAGEINDTNSGNSKDLEEDSGGGGFGGLLNGEFILKNFLKIVAMRFFFGCYGNCNLLP